MDTKTELKLERRKYKHLESKLYDLAGEMVKVEDELLLLKDKLAARTAERDQLIRAQQSAIKTLQQGIGFAGSEYDGWTLGQFIAATIERYAAKDTE